MGTWGLKAFENDGAADWAKAFNLDVVTDTGGAARLGDGLYNKEAASVHSEATAGVDPPLEKERADPG